MSEESSRIKAWDGIRGLACILVLGFHAGLIPGGAVGVDLFFVLSGYLITRSLLSEAAESGGVSLRNFYARRAIRLMPALLVLLTIASSIGVLMGPGYLFGALEWGAPLWVLFFAANWAAVASGEALGVLQPTWSLAIEEQFYLLIAPTFAFLLSKPQRSTWIPWMLGLLAFVSLGIRLSLWSDSGGAYRESSEFYRQYVGLDARAYAPLLGSMIAIPQSASFRGWLSQRRLVVGAIALVLLLVLGWQYNFYHETGIGLLAPPIAVALIVAVRERGAIRSVFEFGAFTWLGRISYSLYLWHIAAFAIVDPVSTMDPYSHPPSMFSLAGMFGLALVLGWLSYRFVEEPAMKYRRSVREWLEQPTPIVKEYRQTSAP